MSYDLFFTFPKPIPRSLVEEYFASRPHYQNNGSVVYQNQDTGVYFVFELHSDTDDDDQLVGASLNLNYFRPHIFGLEAEPEIRAFVECFQPNIEDPQMHGMGEGPFTPDGFLAGWNAGNAFAYESITSQQEGPFLSCPEAKLEAAWRWNKAKAATQESCGDMLFVPSILFVTVDGQLQSAVVWGDGIPTLMPPTDAVIVFRDKLAPKPFFRSRMKDTCIVSPDSLDSLLGPFVEKGYALPVRVPNYEKPSRDIAKFFGNLRAFAGQLQVVSVDQVLTEDMLNRAL